MAEHGHRSAKHEAEIKKGRDAHEAELSIERAHIREETEKFREREQRSGEEKKYRTGGK